MTIPNVSGEQHILTSWGNSVADAINARPWALIGSGDQSSLTLTVPAGTERVRVSWAGNNSADAYLRLRVNNDSTATLYNPSLSILNPAGTVTTSSDGAASSSYLVGTFLGVLNAWGSFEVECQHPRVPFEGGSYRQGIPNGSARMVAWGILAADRTVTTLNLLPSAGTLSSFVWRAEAL